MRTPPRSSIETAHMSATSPIVSPTALTNAIRRDKPHEKRRQTFLAAERFHDLDIAAPMRKSVEARGKGLQPNQAMAHESGRLRRPKSCADVKNIVVDMKESVITEEQIQNMMRQTHSMKADEKQMQGCIQETRKYSDKLAQCANIAFDMFRLKCMPDVDRGDDHGHDDVFFRVGSSLTFVSCDPNQPSSPELVTPPRLSRNRNPPEDTFHSPKGMRYPQAAEIENPLDRSEREKNSPGSRDEDAEVREEAQDDDVVGLGRAMASKGDDQASLRAVRLQMYRVDDSQETVPKARLSRALGELSFQDIAIESLQMSLENTKELLAEKEMALFEAQTLCKEHEQSIADILAKASSDTLEAWFAQESKEKSLLQKKVIALEQEISRLKMALQAAKDEQSENASVGSKVNDDEKHGQSAMDGEDLIWTDISQDDDNSALIVRLRAEIVALKSQLADKHAEHMQRDVANSHLSTISEASSTCCSLNSPEASHTSELIRLRSELENAEAQLAALRAPEIQHRQATSANVAALELQLTKTEGDLKDTRKELEEVMTREATLWREFEASKKKVAELENELAASHMSSLAEVEKLKESLLNESVEAEDAKKIALSELEQSRMEVAELKAEVKRLTQRLSDAIVETEMLSTGSLKQRARLEEALLRSQRTEKELRVKIADLEERLAKAEASSLQLVAPSEGNERSIKRKLDDSFDSETGLVSRESYQANERAQLKEELNRSQASEKALRAEIEAMRKLLLDADDLVEEMETELKKEAIQRKEHEARMMNEVYGLRSKLVASEEKTLQALTARANDLQEHSKHEEELRHCQAKQQALLNQLHLLQATLDRVEIERQQEKLDVIEARRINEDVDSKRMEEMERLREEVEKLRVRADRCSELQSQVEELRVRLATALVESAEMKKRAIKENRKKGELTQSFRGEIKVIKGRLAAIRRRNASRRKVANEDNSTDRSTSEESTPLSPRRIVPLEGSFTSAFHSAKKHDLEFSPSSSPCRSQRNLPYDERTARQETLRTARNGVDVSSLQNRLRESNQRLQDANARLQELAKSSNNIMEEQTSTLNDDLITLVTQHRDASISPDRGRRKLRIQVTHNKPSVVHWHDDDDVYGHDEFSDVNWQEQELASI